MPMVASAKRWTLDELHRLPDDGNKYEIVSGELFVTPAPSEQHETILVRLHARLAAYVDEHQLGGIFRPRAIVRLRGSEVEPDLFVRPVRSGTEHDWDDAPVPLLVVEIISPTTRRRDLMHKRDLYLHAGVDTYWAIDPEARTVRVIRADREDVVTRDTLTWAPSSASVPLTLSVATLFR